MKRILIANRGEIALRIMATAHRMGIETVAVYSDADAHSLHVQQATQAYALGGLTSAQSYLNVSKLLAAAKACAADAVHPGYGFLSEDAGFAQAVQDAGLIWIGPPPSVSWAARRRPSNWLRPMACLACRAMRGQISQRHVLSLRPQP